MPNAALGTALLRCSVGPLQGYMVSRFRMNACATLSTYGSLFPVGEIISLKYKHFILILSLSVTINIGLVEDITTNLKFILYQPPTIVEQSCGRKQKISWKQRNFIKNFVRNSNFFESGEWKMKTSQVTHLHLIATEKFI